MHLILEHIGWQSKSIQSWVAMSLGTINISWRLVMIGNGLMGGSFSLNWYICYYSQGQSREAPWLHPIPISGWHPSGHCFWWLSLCWWFLYALILVNCATWYNWVFGLKTLSLDCIPLALCFFWATAGSLGCCLYCDCNFKLLGTAISEYLIDNGSKLVSAPAKRQSSNGLVESHWKIMVHMAHAFLTEKHMPHLFWFYEFTHTAWMMNTIPGKVKDALASIRSAKQDNNYEASNIVLPYPDS